MRISRQTWKNYAKQLNDINSKAAEELFQWIEVYGVDENGLILDNITEALDKFDNSFIDECNYIVKKYGDASGALSATMYDAIASIEGASVDAAEIAEAVPISDIYKTVNGVLKTSHNPDEMTGAVSRLVKRVGADTMLQNAKRDGAEFAWIPIGDTCAFCIALASRGWQKVGENTLKNGHAEHIHSNCDCNYAVRFDSKSNVEGYDPDKYLEMYNSADGSSKDKINALRRLLDEKNKNIISSEFSAVKNSFSNVFKLNKVDFTPASNIKDAETYAKNSFVGGGFNLTGKEVSYQGFDVDIANRINNRLDEIYEAFDIPKLSSLESFGKANKRVWNNNSNAPMFTTNFGNIGLNNTLIKSQKLIEKYNEQGANAFQYVIDNIDALSGESRKMAEAYKIAGKSLVGNSVEDFITHEIGHHISYMPDINKKLIRIQKETNWEDIAKNLSGYSTHSFGEYFAESFNAFCRGEQDKLQPELVEIFESLRKK